MISLFHLELPLGVILDVLPLVAFHLEAGETMEQIADFRCCQDQVKILLAALGESLGEPAQFLVLLLFRPFPKFELPDLLIQVPIRLAQRNVVCLGCRVPLDP